MSFIDDPHYNILIAEADKNLGIALYDMLQANDVWNVYSATSGQETIDLLDSTPDPPDLVLLDSSLPDQNGLDLLHYMRNSETFQNIPVIMMVAYEEKEEDLSHYIKEGARDYIVKPIRLHNIRVLHNYIKQGVNRDRQSESVNDYEKIRTLGRGASGLVDLVSSKKDLELYAMKIIPIFHFDENKKKAAQNEITLLKV
jgi:two-component system chemotaxis response regulator CheY